LSEICLTVYATRETNGNSPCRRWQLLDKPMVPAVLIDVLPNVVVAMRGWFLRLVSFCVIFFDIGAQHHNSFVSIGLNPTTVEADDAAPSASHNS
jgi:hypothetical protein